MTVEEHVKNHGRLHPDVCLILQRFFPKLDLDTVEFKLVSSIPFKLTIFALADVVVSKYRVLNYHFTQESFKRDDKLWHRGNGAVDLSTDVGIQTLAHELKHCEQWRNTPRRVYWLWYLPGLISSWFNGQRYAHRFMRWEREAIAFQKTVKKRTARTSGFHHTRYTML